METRPSYKLYSREHPMAATLLADPDCTPYGWGWEAAKLDEAAGLAPMTRKELSSLWHRDYSEGYLDYFS